MRLRRQQGRAVRTEVCVVTYDSGDTLPLLVESLGKLPAGTALAVHDNSPQGRTLPLAQELATATGIPFRGEACPTGNCGFAAGCNGLAAGSSGDQLLFLNPDARVLAWPDGLVARGQLVGPRILSSNGETSVTYGDTRGLGDEIALRWLRRTPKLPGGRGYVSGAAMLVARDDFASLGGFDEGFFMYYEDIDLCERAVRAGVPVVLEQSWVVQHVGGHSVGRSAAGLRNAHLRSYRSGRRFHAKHGHSVRGYDALCLVDALARAAARAPRARMRNVAVADWAVAGEAARNLVSPRAGASA